MKAKPKTEICPDLPSPNDKLLSLRGGGHAEWKYQLYVADNKQWTWRRKATNGKIHSTPHETFKRLQGAMKSVLNDCDGWIWGYSEIQKLALLKLMCQRAYEPFDAKVHDLKTIKDVRTGNTFTIEILK